MHHCAVSRATRASIASLADRSAGMRGGGLPASTVNVSSCALLRLSISAGCPVYAKTGRADGDSEFDRVEAPGTRS